MSRLRVARAFLAAMLVLAATGGCGYSLQGNLPDHLKTVSVPVFKNRTTESGAETTITAAVINAFTSNGRLKVVSLDNADSVLDGEVTGYQVQSLTYDSRLNLRSYRLTVTMNVRFRDLRRTELLWQENGLVENVSFDVAGQVSDTISREEGAVKQAALEIGRKIVNRAVDRF
jgi:outer membrane lipopolysaccharide assembly protein LptE/RlpB